MKKLYQMLALVAMMVLTLSANAAGTVWSYDWPVGQSDDKAAGYPNGFYNFGSTMDADITSMNRTLNGKDWTLTFDKGTKLAYLVASGQSVGASGGFTGSFSLKSASFSGKIKQVTVSTRTKVADAQLTVSVNGKAYTSGDATSVCYTTSEKTPLNFTFVPGADGEQEGEIVMYFTIPGATGNAYVKQISVEYEEAASNVPSPTMTPESGSFDEPVEVTINAANGAKIFYTSDGSNPRLANNEAVTEYTGSLTISQTTTLKAVAQVGDEFSAVSEGVYTIRKSPELKFMKESLTIELLEEDVALLDNPNRVEPIKYKSSNTEVAYVDSKGMIYTYAVGETVISASFAGNDTFTPQTVELPVTVVAKEPLSGLTVSPNEGTFNAVTEVTVECTDERAKTLWYYIGDKAMDVDELGILNEFTIHPATKMTLKLDDSCVLTVQAMGDNVWSEPQVCTYTVNVPLKADFEAGDNWTTVYYNGFDSEDEVADWTYSTGSAWRLSTETGLSDLPSFSSINPDSKYSLFHAYASTGDVSVVASPAITVPEGGKVRFYAAFNPIWIYDGNLQLYVCENTEGAHPLKIWDALLASQDAATDDIKWNQYSADLDNYVGKEVKFSFTYALNYGDNVVIDDFEVVAPGEQTTLVKAMCGEPITFHDRSEGKTESWVWQFPGATTETSTEQNPVVTYDKPGTYDVTLTVSKGDDSNTMTRAKYVVISAVPPTAKIGVPTGVYYSPEAGLVVPLNTALTFTDQSTGAPSKHHWTVPGTDIGSSEDKDITVKYTTAGNYDVDLTVSSDAGTSSTYIYGVKAGGKSLAWNIGAFENDKLGMVSLGWYGYYGGSNWLDMTAFAEAFEAPASTVTISSVNVYFASVQAISQDAEVTVAVAKADENGMPGEVLCSSSLQVSQLVDASSTYNDPTTFTFDNPVKVSDKFFVTISGLPKASSDDGDDCVVVYTLRRELGDRCTTYHQLDELDENFQPTGVKSWYKQEDEACSFAIAPMIEFDDPESGVENVDADNVNGEVIYYNLQGIRMNADALTPGIYIKKQGSKSEKVVIK